MRILIKIGGAQLEQATARAALCTAIATAQRDGHELILVHGGGNQIRELCHRLGIEDRYHHGLRITDAETAKAVLCVLGGLVNRSLVHSLQLAGVDAVGLTGADGGTFRASKLEAEGVDLGYVGCVDQVDDRLVERLLAGGLVPVIATVAPGSDSADPTFYNINADHAAAPLAAAFGCQATLFLTDVSGVLDADGTRLSELDAESCAQLRAAGTIHGGMLPKVDAALGAAAQNPDSLVKIAPADGADAVRVALSPAGGTCFHG